MTLGWSKGKPTTFRVYFADCASSACALRVCVSPARALKGITRSMRCWSAVCVPHRGRRGASRGFVRQPTRGDHRMIRTMFAVAAVVLGVGVAVAQQDVIKERKAIMKTNGDQAKIGAGMDKGEQPFALAAAQKIFANYTDAATKTARLF